jgi:hypothetical protein
MYELTAFLRRVIFSPWMIPALLVLAWFPLFIADFIREVNLVATYRLAAFAMGWMGITMLCSLGAIVLTVGHLIRLVFRLVQRDDTQQ